MSALMSKGAKSADPLYDGGRVAYQCTMEDGNKLIAYNGYYYYGTDTGDAVVHSKHTFKAPVSIVANAWLRLYGSSLEKGAV